MLDSILKFIQSIVIAVTAGFTLFLLFKYGNREKMVSLELAKINLQYADKQNQIKYKSDSLQFITNALILNNTKDKNFIFVDSMLICLIKTNEDGLNDYKFTYYTYLQNNSGMDLDINYSIFDCYQAKSIEKKPDLFYNVYSQPSPFILSDITNAKAGKYPYLVSKEGPAGIWTPQYHELCFEVGGKTDTNVFIKKYINVFKGDITTSLGDGFTGKFKSKEFKSNSTDFYIKCKKTDKIYLVFSFVYNGGSTISDDYVSYSTYKDLECLNLNQKNIIK